LSLNSWTLSYEKCENNKTVLGQISGLNKEIKYCLLSQISGLNKEIKY